MKNTDNNVALNHLRVLLFRCSTVKTHRHVVLAVVLLSFVALTQPATARADVVKITNGRTDRVKICVYNATDKYMVIALRCWTLEKNESVTWDRGREDYAFNLLNIDMSEVWKPQGVKDGSFARTFIYAKSGRFIQQIWEGREQDYDPSFCIDQKKAFAIRQFEIKDNKRFAVACKGTNLEVVHFFEIPNPEFNKIYSWTFK